MSRQETLYRKQHSLKQPAQISMQDISTTLVASRQFNWSIRMLRQVLYRLWERVPKWVHLALEFKCKSF